VSITSKINEREYIFRAHGCASQPAGREVCKIKSFIKLLKINDVEVFFCVFFPDIRKSSGLFEGSEDSPACPSDKSNIKMKKGMEHWRNDTAKRKRE
jgi:hypothetical protein